MAALIERVFLAGAGSSPRTMASAVPASTSTVSPTRASGTASRATTWRAPWTLTIASRPSGFSGFVGVCGFAR
jgi:hypothetical protein